MITAKKLCIAVHAAMDDELRDTNKYDKLLGELRLIAGLSRDQSIMLNKIKQDEANHHRMLSELYQQLGCDTRIEDMVLEKEQYLLPKDERIRRAKLFVSQF